MPEIEAGILPANRPHPLELACFLIASNGDGGTMQRTVGCASFARPPAASLLLASTAMSKSHTTVTNVLCAAPRSAPNGRTAVRYFKFVQHWSNRPFYKCSCCTLQVHRSPRRFHPGRQVFLQAHHHSLLASFANIFCSEEGYWLESTLFVFCTENGSQSARL